MTEKFNSLSAKVSEPSSPTMSTQEIDDIRSEVETFLDTLTRENTRLEDEIEKIKLTNKTIFERLDHFDKGEMDTLTTKSVQNPVSYDVIDPTSYGIGEDYGDSEYEPETVPRTINDRLAILESQMKDVEWSIARVDTMNQVRLSRHSTNFITTFYSFRLPTILTCSWSHSMSCPPKLTPCNTTTCSRLSRQTNKLIR